MLHEAILNGKLPAGSRLKIRDLAEMVGTSVMPVREAIRKLEEAGLAERKPHKGAVVTDLTFEELSQIYAIRLILESEAAALGAEKVSESETKRMETELGKMRQAIQKRNIIEYLDRDEAFLEMLYAASANPVLVSLIKSLWLRCRAYKIVGARRSFDKDKLEELWKHQETLLKAAKSRNATKARGASEKSLTEASDRIKVTLESKSSSNR